MNLKIRDFLWKFSSLCILLTIVISIFSYGNLVLRTVRDIVILREQQPCNAGSPYIPLVSSVWNSSDALPPACQVNYKGCHVLGFAKLHEIGRKCVGIAMHKMKRIDRLRWFSSLAIGQYRECAQLSRMGGKGDGGKWMCDKPYKPVVYSLGSSNQFSFEEDMTSSFQAEIHTFDCTIAKGVAIEVPKGVTFHPWCVGLPRQNNPAFFNLSTIMQRLNHKRIDILKMDIEGSEYAVFKEMQTLPRHSLPKQIMFELHVEGNSPIDVVRNFVVLNDYKIFSVEPNSFCPHCCEYSMTLSV